MSARKESGADALRRKVRWTNAEERGGLSRRAYTEKRAQGKAQGAALSERQKDATIEAQRVAIETWCDEANRLRAEAREKDATSEAQRVALREWREEWRRALDALALAAPGEPDSAWYAIGRAQAVILHALGVDPDEQDRELHEAEQRAAEERARVFCKE